MNMKKKWNKISFYIFILFYSFYLLNNNTRKLIVIKRVDNYNNRNRMDFILLNRVIEFNYLLFIIILHIYFRSYFYLIILLKYDLIFSNRS